MKLTSHEEYGLRCLLQLCGQPEGLTIPEISRAEHISTHYVAKLMGMLRRGGLVKSTRGQAGGYALARPAGRISVSEALAVLGGRLYDPAFCERHAGHSLECHHSVDCSVRALWRTIQESVDRILAKTTLQDLCRTEGEMTSWVTLGAEVRPVNVQ